MLNVLPLVAGSGSMVAQAWGLQRGCGELGLHHLGGGLLAHSRQLVLGFGRRPRSLLAGGPRAGLLEGPPSVVASVPHSQPDRAEEAQCPVAQPWSLNFCCIC